MMKLKNKNNKIYIYNYKNLIKQALVDYIQILNSRKIKIIDKEYDLKKVLKN